MNKKSQSEPRLRQVQTSRIRDGRYSNQKQPLKNNYMSAQKPKHYDNPQSPYKIPQKCHHQAPTPKQQLLMDQVPTAPESPIKKITDQEPPKIKFQDRKQETFNGRKLQYPHHTHQKAGYASTSNQNQPKLQRAQSASTYSSRHYVDRMKKSRQIQEKHAADDEKMKVVMNYLLETNEDYLAERSRICNQRARPKEEIFKINLAQTPSTYKDHYPPKQAPYQFHMEPQNEKTANSFGPKKVCGNSMNNEAHNGRKGPKADLATWPEGYKLQGPIDGTTTYANKFPDHGDYEKMVPIATFNEHPMGFPHTANSTHRSHFDGKWVPRSDIAEWNNLHPYGNDFNPDRGTHYGDKHNSKDQPGIQQWPNDDPRHLAVKGKFSTEYKDRFINEHGDMLNEEKDCKCRKSRKRIYK